MFGMRHKNNFLVLVIAGIFIGLQWHDQITNFLHGNIKKEPTLTLFCPSPDAVALNQDNVSSFQVNAQDWRVDYHGWHAPKKIGFMQALFTDGDTITCYYHWQNPAEPGTNLWMTVKLLPSVAQTIQPYGTYWMKTGEHEQLCTAGINACAYTVIGQAPVAEGDASSSTK